MAGNDTTDALERLINLGHVAGGVGHHVINAFSAIVSNAELLRLDPPIPSIADPAALADTIIKSAVEAATVARRLIDYTRPVTSIEPDRAAFQPDTVRLDLLVAEVVALESAARPGYNWTTDLAPLHPIRGHAAQLRTMVLLLLANAYEAMPRGGGNVSVCASTDARGWNVLEVRDSGSGMDPTTLERSVEPFFSTKPGHLGIGLSIANGIWRRHRGTLAIHSQPGEGTRIRLCVEPTADAT
jgi:signal transduction histidine kinase